MAFVCRTVSPILLLSLLGLAACSPSAPKTATAPAAKAASSLAEAVKTAPDTPSAPVSCADEIGATAAQKRADICRTVSPATHPPCNVANSCAMIEDEIARSCALFDGQGSAMPGCSLAPQSQAAAVAVVTRYYSALNARDYATAWTQWGDNGPPHQSLKAFQAGFVHTRSTHVAIGAPAPSEGGAGSIYQTVPVVVDAVRDDGQSQRFTGEYVIRRVNGVDGASPDQLRWHIDQAHLKPAAPQ